MSYTYNNTTTELQKAADAGLALWQTSGVIQSDGNGNISEKPVDAEPTEGSTNLVESGIGYL